jgi:hypothetical protein
MSGTEISMWRSGAGERPEAVLGVEAVGIPRDEPPAPEARKLRVSEDHLDEPFAEPLAPV